MTTNNHETPHVLNGRAWTDEELTYLDNHKNDALTDIAQALGRTEHSVRNKMLRLGYIERQRTARFWTEREDSYLYAQYGNISAAAIGKHLKRSKQSVMHHAAALGLRAYDEYLSQSLLAQAFSIDQREVKRWIERFGMPAKKTKHGRSIYMHIDIDAFWPWAKAHQSIIPWHSYDGSLGSEPEWVENAIQSDRVVNHRRPITRSVRRQVSVLQANGHSIQEIADALGRTPNSIKHIFSGPRLKHVGL